MDHSAADRELSKNTLDNHSTTAKCFSHSFKLTALEMLTVAGTENVDLREVSLLVPMRSVLITLDCHYMIARQLIGMIKCINVNTNTSRENAPLI